MSDAQTRGWGPGWPNCQENKIVPLVVSGTSFPGGCRAELRELLTRLILETKKRGYVFGVPGNPSYGCWGFNCRPVRGTQTASNHSWGLAVDINAPSNPQKKPLTTNMPAWMPDLWKAYGFRWGGTYTTLPDAMHYEFMGTPTDCMNYTLKARRNYLGATQPKPPVPKPPEPTPKPPTVPAPTPPEDDVPVQPFRFYQFTNDTKVWLVPVGHHVRHHVPGQQELQGHRSALYVEGLVAGATGWSGEIMKVDPASAIGKMLESLPIV